MDNETAERINELKEIIEHQHWILEYSNLCLDNKGKELLQCVAIDTIERLEKIKKEMTE